MFPQAKIEFPGIKQILSFSGTWNHGVEPSGFALEIVPQPPQSIALYGGLRFTYGDESWEIPNCLVDSGTYSINSNGAVVGLIIKDYRWRWRYATITGMYNIRDERGDIIELDDDSGLLDDCIRKTRRDTNWLINRLLDSMECFTREIAGVWSEYYPECIWDNENAALALNDILVKNNLRLAPQLDGSVRVVNVNSGVSLPQDAIETYGRNINPPEKPRRIRAVSGPTYYTVDMLLTPVICGADFATPMSPDPNAYTGNKDLRKNSIISGFSSNGFSEQQRKRLEVSAFKWFRVCNGGHVSNVFGGPKLEFVGGYGPKTLIPASADFNNLNPLTVIDNGIGEPLELEFGWAFPDSGLSDQHHIEYLSQFEIQDFCCERIRTAAIAGGDTVSSYPFSRPFVWGAFYHDSDGEASEAAWNSQNSADSIKDVLLVRSLSYIPQDDEDNPLRRFICPVPFQIEPRLGLVKFSSPVYLVKAVEDGEDSQSIQWPELALRCAIRVKNKGTGNWIRCERELEIDPSSPAKEVVIRVDELNVYYELDGTSNINQVTETLDDILYKYNTENFLYKYEQSYTATYAKWFSFELDGAIQSITWSMGEGGAKMSISRNIDTGTDTALSYDIRQRIAQAKRGQEYMNSWLYRAKREQYNFE